MMCSSCVRGIYFHYTEPGYLRRFNICNINIDNLWNVYGELKNNLDNCGLVIEMR